MRKVWLVLSFILISILLSACSPKPVRVEGAAMMPTFRNGVPFYKCEGIK